jgi:RNA polymerase sigma-70 factor (ECF subfamily)
VNTLPAAQAVEQLARDYGKLVFYTIYGMTGEWEESQDLTQETFVQALKAIDAARASAPGAVFHAKAWLLQIAINTVRMQRRRRALFRFIPFSYLRQESQVGEQEVERVESVLAEQRVPVQPGGYASREVEDPAGQVAEQDAVRRAMALLPEASRACLLLSITAGLSTAEIATLLDMQEATVRQRIARARKQFQQAYTRESGELLTGNQQNTFSRTASQERVTGIRGDNTRHRLTLLPRQ